MSDRTLHPYLTSVEYPQRVISTAAESKPTPATLTIEATRQGLTLSDNKGGRLITSQDASPELVCAHFPQTIADAEALANLIAQTTSRVIGPFGILKDIAHVSEGLKGSISYVKGTVNLPEHAPSPLAELCHKATSAGIIRR